MANYFTSEGSANLTTGHVTTDVNYIPDIPDYVIDYVLDSKNKGISYVQCLNNVHGTNTSKVFDWINKHPFSFSWYWEFSNSINSVVTTNRYKETLRQSTFNPDKRND